MTELYYNAYSVAYFVVSQEMGSKTQMTFLENLYEDEKEFILPYYKWNKKAFFSDVLYFEDYLIDREKLDKEFPVIKKDITASGRQFDIAEKMSDYPDIDLFFYDNEAEAVICKRPGLYANETENAVEALRL